MPMAGSDFEIDEMTAEALDEVLALWQETEGVGLSEGDTKDDLVAFLARNPGLSLVARHNGRIVGAVLCGHDGRRGFLYHLAVAAPYRRQGIGRALIETCLQRLALLGIRKCNIVLYRNNEIGERFWNRNGWKERIDLKILQKRTPSSSHPIPAVWRKITMNDFAKTRAEEQRRLIVEQFTRTGRALRPDARPLPRGVEPARPGHGRNRAG